MTKTLDQKMIAAVSAPSDWEKLIRKGHLAGFKMPRIVLLGRSNVGKSSLLNALLGTKEAKVSKTPGKTRTLYFYLADELGVIVADVPGYGFAKRSREEKDRWSALIETYLESDTEIGHLFILLDARHGPTTVDEEAIEFLGKKKFVECVWVMTKWDELKNQKERSQRVREVESTKNIRRKGPSPSNIFWVSAKDKTGIQELKFYIKESLGKK